MYGAFPREFTLTPERRKHILERSEMQGQLQRVYKTLQHPDIVRRSVRSDDILLFHKWYPTSPVTEKYMAVVVRQMGKKGLIVTAYYTDRVKPGEAVWER